MAKRYVLDASALLATLFDEPGAAVVDAALGHSSMSAVNYSEVIAKQVRMGEDPVMAARLIDSIHLPIIPWDADLAREASDLSVLAWTHGLSLGDRACLATARRLRSAVLTADRNWRKLPDLGIKIKVIREP
ncbi:MAG: type II toxin-antitoxin system VapC family toxin [Bryobacterales bacterium]|nr:type II toxin-antitoxin system VapC family toxin [Bryobacterales bacterium]